MSKSIISKLFRLVDIKTYEEFPMNYDIKVIDPTFYSDLLNYKTLGFGEAYMTGKFVTPNLEILLRKLQKINTLSLWKLLRFLQFKDYLYFLKYCIFKLAILLRWYFQNPQSIIKSKVVAKEHYDLPDILYQKMLDSGMVYSCGYWNNVDTLEEAQKRKAELIIQKLKIDDGDQVLEIGSGWGFISYAIAKIYPKSNVLGISISKEQIAYCHQKYNLPNLRFELRDYRDLQKNSYHKIYSVGMFEHVGYKNYQEFFNISYSLLRNNGIMLLHTITKHQESKTNDPWFDKYIFPGGYLPSIGEVIKVTENTNFMLADLQEFGDYYALTLDAWLQNFQKNYNNLQESRPDVFTKRFQRMWEFYLVMSKVGFASRYLHLAQFVFTKNYDRVYVR